MKKLLFVFVLGAFAACGWNGELTQTDQDFHMQAIVRGRPYS